MTLNWTAIADPVFRLHRRILPEKAGLGWAPYLWLCYSGFFFATWFWARPSALEVVLSLVTLAVFVVLYFRIFHYEGRQALMHLLAILALGLVWAPFNVNASVFFIYAASFACLVGPVRRAMVLLLGIVALAGIWGWLVQPSVFFWFWAMGFSLVVGAGNIIFVDRSRQQDALRLSQKEVEQLARVAERERIARDMHDILGHSLLLVILKSELAGKLVKSDPERAEAEIRAVEEHARRALAEVREAIGGYRERSLEAELEHARLVLLAACIELTTQVTLPALQPRAEAVLALVIREAITNVARHSQARHCRIQLEVVDNELLLEISDDGVGGIRVDGSGVDGMRARIESLGGRLSVGNRRADVSARLPLSAEMVQAGEAA